MMGETGQADIVVPVKAKALGKQQRCIGLSLVEEGLRTMSDMGIDDCLHAVTPVVGRLLRSDGLPYGRFELGDEGVEVIYLPRTPEISTTKVKDDLSNPKNKFKC